MCGAEHTGIFHGDQGLILVPRIVLRTPLESLSNWDKWVIRCQYEHEHFYYLVT